jgi:hypothetical protein
MVSQQTWPAAHAGFATAPEVFAARSTHWVTVAAGLLIAAHALADGYLQEERDDIRACVDVKHHQAIRNLFEAIKSADRAGLADACADLQTLSLAAPVEFWSVINDKFTACSLSDLIRENDWLRPGDVVYQSTVVRRHALTTEDFAVAATENAPACDPRVLDMFEAGDAA